MTGAFTTAGGIRKTAGSGHCHSPGRGAHWLGAVRDAVTMAQTSQKTAAAADAGAQDPAAAVAFASPPAASASRPDNMRGHDHRAGRPPGHRHRP